MGAGRGEGSASDEPQSNERVSSVLSGVELMGAGRGEGSASDEPQSNERVSSERDN
jgi:hypothetical protein